MITAASDPSEPMAFRWLLSAAAIAVLVASFVFTPESLPDVPLCPLRAWFGVSCPGCGMTRGFCAISHGGLAQAWSFNPFAFVFYATAVAIALLPLVARFATGLEERVAKSRMLGIVALILATSLLAFGIARICHELSLRN